jgi:hypothetical protein
LPRLLPPPTIDTVRIPLLISVCVFVTALLVPVLDDPPLHSGCYVQDLRVDGASVALIDAVPRTLGTAAAFALADPDARSAPADAKPVATAADEHSAPRRRHVFRFTGLEAGRRYAYRVTDTRGEVVGEGSFRTLATDQGQRVRFAILGDSGGVPWWGWMQQSPGFHTLAGRRWLPLHGPTKRVAAQVEAARPDWFAHVGDVVYPRGENRFYGPVYFWPFENVLAHSAGYLVMGNHDDANNRDDGGAGRPLLQNSILPRSEATGGERLFSFADGPVRLIGIDCSFLLHSETEAGRAQQELVLDYLRTELQAAREPWKIVCQHYPIRTSDPTRQSPWTRDVLLPLLREHGVDLAFSGHDHNYQRFGEPSGDRPICVVTGGGGKDLYDMPESAPEFAARSRSFHFCIVEADANGLEVRAIDERGNEVDRFALTK